MGHSRKDPYHPHSGNIKLTPLPPSDVLIHLLLSETIFSPLLLRTAEISSMGEVWIFSGTTQSAFTIYRCYILIIIIIIYMKNFSTDWLRGVQFYFKLRMLCKLTKQEQRLETSWKSNMASGISSVNFHLFSEFFCILD